MFGPAFTPSQFGGIEGILDAFAAYGDGRIKTLAYALATARREVGAGMVPVREGFRPTDASARAYVRRKYGHKGAAWYCWPAGEFGHVYYGRGIAQITWLDNYADAEARTGLPFVSTPDLALEPEIAARLLITGLIAGQWNGRGHGIAYYLPDAGPDDLMNARRTVNITDHWQEIAGHYREFLAALGGAGMPAVLVPDPLAGIDVTAHPAFAAEPDPWGAADARFEDAEILAHFHRLELPQGGEPVGILSILKRIFIGPLLALFFSAPAKAMQSKPKDPQK
jgi:hypothetical protein